MELSMYVANLIVLFFSSAGVLVAMIYGREKDQRGWFFFALSLLLLAVLRFVIINIEEVK